MEWLYTKLQDTFEGKLIWSKDDYQPIIDFLDKSISAKSVILVKGSRGMALENIIEPFIEPD